MNELDGRVSDGPRFQYWKSTRALGWEHFTVYGDWGLFWLLLSFTEGPLHSSARRARQLAYFTPHFFPHKLQTCIKAELAAGTVFMLWEVISPLKVLDFLSLKKEMLIRQSLKLFLVRKIAGL